MARRRLSSVEVADYSSNWDTEDSELQASNNVILLSAHVTTATPGSNPYDDVFVPSPRGNGNNPRGDTHLPHQSGYMSKTLPRGAKFSLNHPPSSNGKVKTSKLGALKNKLLGRSSDKQGRLDITPLEDDDGGRAGGKENPLVSTQPNRRPALLGSKILSRSMESLFKNRKLARTYAIDLNDSDDGPFNNGDGTCDSIYHRVDRPAVPKPRGPPPPVPVNFAHKTRPRSKSLDFDDALDVFDIDDKTGEEIDNVTCADEYVTVTSSNVDLSQPKGPPPPVPAMGPATRRLRSTSVDMSKYTLNMSLDSDNGGSHSARSNIYGNMALVPAPRPTVPPPPPPVPKSPPERQVKSATGGDQEYGGSCDGVIIDDVVVTKPDLQVAERSGTVTNGTPLVNTDTEHVTDTQHSRPSAALSLTNSRNLPGNTTTKTPLNSTLPLEHPSSLRRSWSLDCLVDEARSDIDHWDAHTGRAGDRHDPHPNTAAFNVRLKDPGHINDITQKTRPALKKKPPPGTPPKPKLGSLLASQGKRSFSQSLESLLVRNAGTFNHVVSIDIQDEVVSPDRTNDTPLLTPEVGDVRKELRGRPTVLPSQVPSQAETRKAAALTLCMESSVDGIEPEVEPDIISKGSVHSEELSDDFSVHIRKQPQQQFCGTGRLGPQTELVDVNQELAPKPSKPQVHSLPLSETGEGPSTQHTDASMNKDSHSHSSALPKKPMDFKALLAKNKGDKTHVKVDKSVESDVTMATTSSTSKGSKSAMFAKKPMGFKSVLRKKNTQQGLSTDSTPALDSDPSSSGPKGFKSVKSTPTLKGLSFGNKPETNKSIPDAERKRHSGHEPVKKALLPPSRPLKEIIASRRSIDNSLLGPTSRVACVDIDIDKTPEVSVHKTDEGNNPDVSGKPKTPPKVPPKVKPVVPLKKLETTQIFQGKQSSVDSGGSPTLPDDPSQVVGVEDCSVSTSVTPKSSEPSLSPSRLSPAESTAAYIRASTPKGYAKGSVFTYTNVNKDRTVATKKDNRPNIPFYSKVHKKDTKDTPLKPSDIKLKSPTNKKVVEGKPRPSVPKKPGQLLSKLQSQASTSDITVPGGGDSIYDDTREVSGISTESSNTGPREPDLYDDLDLAVGRLDGGTVNESDGGMSVDVHTPTQSECYDDVEVPVKSGGSGANAAGPPPTTTGHKGILPLIDDSGKCTSSSISAAPSSGVHAILAGLKRKGQKDNVSTSRQSDPPESYQDKTRDTQTKGWDANKSSDNESNVQRYELLSDCTSLTSAETESDQSLKHVSAKAAAKATLAGPGQLKLGQSKGQTVGSKQNDASYTGEGIYEELPEFSPVKLKQNKVPTESNAHQKEPTVSANGLNSDKNVRNSSGSVSGLQFGNKGDQKVAKKPQSTPVARIEPFRPTAYDEVYIEGRALKVQLNDLYDDLDVCKSALNKEDSEDIMSKPEDVDVVNKEHISESTSSSDNKAKVILRRPKAPKTSPCMSVPFEAMKKSHSAHEFDSASGLDLSAILRLHQEDTTSLGSNAESVSSVESSGMDHVTQPGVAARRLSSPVDSLSYVSENSLAHSESDSALSAAEGDQHMSHDSHMKHLAKVNQKVHRSLGAKHLSKLYVANIKGKTANFKNIPKYLSKSATSIQVHFQGSRKSLGDLSEQVQKMLGLGKKEKPLPSVPAPDYQEMQDAGDSESDWSDSEFDDHDYTNPDEDLQRGHCYPQSEEVYLDPVAASDGAYLTPLHTESKAMSDVPTPPPSRPNVPNRIGDTLQDKEEDSDEDYEVVEDANGGWLPQQPPKDYRNRPPAPTPAPIPVPTPPSRSIQNNLQASILEGQQKLRKTPVEPPTPVAKPSPLPAPATKPKNLTPPNKPIPAAKPVVPEKPARTVARLRDNISEKNQNATPLNFRNGPEKPKLLVTSNADQSASGEVSQGKPSSSRPMKKLPPTPGPGKLQVVTQRQGGKDEAPPLQPSPNRSRPPVPSPSKASPPELKRSDRPLPPVPIIPSNSNSNTTTSSSNPLDSDDLYSYPWYFGSLPRDRVNEKLKSVGQDSTFLIRKTHTGGGDRPYTLCLLFNDKVWNLHIRIRPDKKFALGLFKGNEKTFSTVEELVRHHKEKNLILAGSNGGETTLKQWPSKKHQ